MTGVWVDQIVRETLSLGLSVKVFLEEISLRISRLSEEDLFNTTPNAGKK